MATNGPNECGDTPYHRDCLCPRHLSTLSSTSDLELHATQPSDTYTANDTRSRPKDEVHMMLEHETEAQKQGLRVRACQDRGQIIIPVSN